MYIDNCVFTSDNVLINSSLKKRTALSYDNFHYPVILYCSIKKDNIQQVFINAFIKNTDVTQKINFKNTNQC